MTMNGLEIAGGIALILFGGRLLAWLSRLTASRVHAFFAGIVTGAATPSSTSISLLAALGIHFAGVLR